MGKRIKKVGLVVMGNISEGGGYPRVVYDLISILNDLGKEVYLLTPFKLDYKKIEHLYGPIKIKKIYNPGTLRFFLGREDVLRRRLMKREFQEMAKEVDFIIDVCGRIVDKYLPKDFKKENYVIWALTSMHKSSLHLVKSFKRNLKDAVRRLLTLKMDLPGREYRIYAVDNWTADDLISKSHLSPEKECLYPPIQVKELLYKGRKKKNQIIVNGRIDPVKRIEDSISIFACGTRNYPNYGLMIIGGSTPESKEYIKLLEETAENLKIKDRIEIIQNPSFKQIKEELLNSKVLIDCQRAANLTMTAIEGMAAGNIILSSKDSSTYKEILGNGKFGHGFENVKEGGEILEKVLKELEKGESRNKKSIERAKFFSKEKFVQRLKEILKE